MELNEKSRSNGSKVLLVTAMVLVAVLSSLITALFFLKLYEKPVYAPLTEMADTIEKYYYYADDKTTDETLIDSALRGMIAGIGDRYAQYYTAEEYQELLQQDSGEYTGLGISVSEPDAIGSRIIKVYDGSPAHTAGVQAGDVITVVNGMPAGGLTLSELMSLFHPAGGEADTLTLMRGDTVFSVTLERALVHVPRVHSKLMDNGVGYIRIEEFTGAVGSEFRTAVDTLTGEGMSKLIVDLRNNPGGGLTEVLNVTDRIVDKGDLIVTIKSRTGDSDVYRAEEDGLNIPIAVLVNGNSASASELFSGAVQDNGKGVIIGTRTFGKGIVQSYFRLQSNSGWVKMTTDAYFTPSDVCIHEVGITPDVTVELEEQYKLMDVLDIPFEADAQLQAAVEYLSKTESSIEGSKK